MYVYTHIHISIHVFKTRAGNCQSESWLAYLPHDFDIDAFQANLGGATSCTTNHLTTDVNKQEL